MNTAKTYNMVVRWGTSRGADTYGYTTCTASVDGKRLGSCNGGGYDLEGTAIAEAIARLFPAELVQLARTEAVSTYNRTTRETTHRRRVNGTYAEGLYGLSLLIEEGKPDRASLDGACGLSCVWKVLRALGYDAETIDRTSRRTVYRIAPITPKE